MQRSPENYSHEGRATEEDQLLASVGATTENRYLPIGLDICKLRQPPHSEFVTADGSSGGGGRGSSSANDEEGGADAKNNKAASARKVRLRRLLAPARTRVCASATRGGCGWLPPASDTER